MKDASGKYVGLGLGDVSPEVVALQKWLAKQYKSYAGSLVATGTYDQATANAVAESQRRLGLQPTGIADYAWKVKSGYVKLAPKAPKVIGFSVEGHMSDMWHGPVADTLTILHKELRLHHQPTGYQNGAVPFDNASGVNQLVGFYSSDRLPDGTPFPAGTKSVLADFSQGSIVVTDFVVNHLLPGQQLAWRTPDILGRLSYGNPTRSRGSVAPWSRAQAGPAANSGLDPLVRFDVLGINSPFPQMDVYRKGDIFSDNEPTTGTAPKATSLVLPAIPGVDLSWLTQAGSLLGGASREGDVKAAVYQAVARGDLFSNPFSIVSAIANLFTVPLEEVWAIFQAIISGIGFLASGNSNPHYAPWNIDGGLNWVRSLLP